MVALARKVAIVTGASSGIGRAVARLFAREGARLVLAARRRSELEALAAEIAADGGEALAMPGDVRNEAFAAELVAAANARFGGLDVAFNNAGTLGAMGPTHEIPAEGWAETLATNLTSAFYAAKHQAPAVLARGGGSLIFTSTFVGYASGMPGMAAYAASKAGVVGLVRALAVELGPRGVRVNALLPGGVDTPMGRAVAHTPELLSFVAGLHAVKRVATPEEIAPSVLYLASDMSRFTTGSAFLVDGGVSINKT
ncbi:MAG TPA: SDR family oxidoreductase [Gammaproteobacteria bacterium]|nr:SDR family oxidoreductase [Gammaproteobacteria bacterium]